jgi:hypothetical protein
MRIWVLPIILSEGKLVLFSRSTVGLSCLVLHTPLAGRVPRAGGRAGPPPPPQYMPRRALASPRVGARITRVRVSTKSNYLSHIRSSHIRLQPSVDHCQTGAASEPLSTAVARACRDHTSSHTSHYLSPTPTHSLWFPRNLPRCHSRQLVSNSRH